VAFQTPGIKAELDLSPQGGQFIVVASAEPHTVRNQDWSNSCRGCRYSIQIQRTPDKQSDHLGKYQQAHHTIQHCFERGRFDLV
jgi:hypothetical protein